MKSAAHSWRTGNGDGLEATSPMRLYLARHGRTRLNAAGVLRGRLDPPLDDVGRLQAHALAESLAQCELELIVASPLVRARETAEAVASRTGLAVEIDHRLVDRDYGPWAGHSKEEVIAAWGSLNGAPDIEPEGLVVDRALAALMGICERAIGGAALVVSHDAVNGAVLPVLDPRLADVNAVAQDTGSFAVIDRIGVEWSVLSVNNTPVVRAP